MSPSNHIRRDMTTMALYGLYSAWGWFIFGFGSSMDLVATDLGVSKGQAGLTMSAIAIGSIVAGAGAATVTARWGRRNALLLAAAFMVAGVVLIVTGQVLAVVAAGAVCTGLGGPLMLTTANPALLAHHGPAGPAAVTEANAAVAAVGMVAPFVTSLAVGAGFSWRHAIAIGAVLALVAGLVMARVPTAGALDGRRHTLPPNTGPARFPGVYWVFWVVSVACIGLESSTTTWAPAVMTERLGLEPARATGLISLLLAGMLIGRLVFGRLSLRHDVGTLLTVSFGIGFAGWLAFWLATTPTWAAVALVVAGIGYGVNFPFMMVMVVRAARSRADRATGLATVAQGLGAACISPSLGFVIDQVGAHTAFAAVGAIALVGLGLSAYGVHRLNREQTTPMAVSAS